MSSFLCFICHSTVNADTNEDTREKYREVVGLHLCPDSHLCHICCHVLNRLALFRAVCLKRSLEYPVLFSEKGTLNLQRNDLEFLTLCPEDSCGQYHSRNINSKTYDFHCQSEHFDHFDRFDHQDELVNQYVELRDENVNKYFNNDDKGFVNDNIIHNTDDVSNFDDNTQEYTESSEDNYTENEQNNQSINQYEIDHNLMNNHNQIKYEQEHSSMNHCYTKNVQEIGNHENIQYEHNFPNDNFQLSNENVPLEESYTNYLLQPISNEIRLDKIIDYNIESVEKFTLTHLEDNQRNINVEYEIKSYEIPLNNAITKINPETKLEGNLNEIGENTTVLKNRHEKEEKRNEMNNRNEIENIKEIEESKTEIECRKETEERRPEIENRKETEESRTEIENRNDTEEKRNEVGEIATKTDEISLQNIKEVKQEFSQQLIEETPDKTEETKKKKKSAKKKLSKKIVLTFEQQKAVLEAKRKEKKYLEAEFKCYNCALGFLFKDTYQAHMMRHEESNGEHKCPLCALRFASPRVLRAHRACHARVSCSRCDRARCRCDTAGAACHMCGMTFSASCHLQQHLKRFHRIVARQRPCVCGVCATTHTTRAAVRTHMIKHITRKFPCNQCPSVFSSPYTLNQHKKKHVTALQLHYCVSCNTGYATRKSLLAHRRNALVHQDTVLECPICARSCPNQRSLASHMESVHSTAKNYVCTLCPNRYTNRKSLMRHVKSHEAKPEVKKAVCHLCGKSFKGTNKLNRHLREVCEKNKLEEQNDSLYDRVMNDG